MIDLKLDKRILWIPRTANEIFGVRKVKESLQRGMQKIKNY